MRLIDTHCHLNDASAFPMPELAVAEAVAAGVERMIVVGIDTESSRLAVQLSESFEEVFAVVGWHPNHASAYVSAELSAIKELLAHPKVVALGEIGLDFYRDHASRDDQYRCLYDQLDLAAETGARIVFHCRDAYPELLDVLEKRPVAPYLFHCFAGSPEDSRRASAMNAAFGVDGPVTYKSSGALREVLAGLPRDKVVIETDSPWMSPVPYRGQRNRPAWLPFVNEGLAESLNLSRAECAELTTANALAFFGGLGY